MGGGEGREEEAEEEREGELDAMAMADDGGELAVGSTGTLCYCRSHQHRKYSSSRITRNIPNC